MPRHHSIYAVGRHLYRIGPLRRLWMTVVTKEITQLPDGELLHHPRRRCAGTHCSLHNPMPGPWSSWPLKWHPGSQIMERVCPHGTPHPAVEQFAYWQATDQTYKMIHKCDGCPCDLTTIDGEHEPTSLES
ncbi:MAG: hypothetical protein ABW022_08685 [Actinoplanes sp.]